jgi:hypothetical protein
MDEKLKALRKRRGPAEIQQLLAEFANSGLKPREFCAGREMALSTLQRYRRKAKQKPEMNRGRLLPVELRSGAGEKESGLAVVVGPGRRIAVQSGFDESTLKRLVDVLERV